MLSIPRPLPSCLAVPHSRSTSTCCRLSSKRLARKPAARCRLRHIARRAMDPGSTTGQPRVFIDLDPSTRLRHRNAPGLACSSALSTADAGARGHGLDSFGGPSVQLASTSLVAAGLAAATAACVGRLGRGLGGRQLGSLAPPARSASSAASLRCFSISDLLGRGQLEPLGTLLAADAGHAGRAPRRWARATSAAERQPSLNSVLGQLVATTPSIAGQRARARAPPAR